MRLLVFVLAALGICATASPIVYKACKSITAQSRSAGSLLNIAAGVEKRVDADEAVVYPDEQFYAEDFKRCTFRIAGVDSLIFVSAKPGANLVSAVDADESVVYPDEEFYAEDF